MQHTIATSRISLATFQSTGTQPMCMSRNGRSRPRKANPIPASAHHVPRPPHHVPRPRDTSKHTKITSLSKETYFTLTATWHPLACHIICEHLTYPLHLCTISSAPLSSGGRGTPSVTFQRSGNGSARSGQSPGWISSLTRTAHLPDRSGPVSRGLHAPRRQGRGLTVCCWHTCILRSKLRGWEVICLTGEIQQFPGIELVIRNLLLIFRGSKWTSKFQI